jgi:hypothetical protein
MENKMDYTKSQLIKINTIKDDLNKTENIIIDLYKFIKIMKINRKTFDQDDLKNVYNYVYKYQKYRNHLIKKIKLIKFVKKSIFDKLHSQLSERISILKSQKILSYIPNLEDQLVFKQIQLQNKLNNINNILLSC